MAKGTWILRLAKTIDGSPILLIYNEVPEIGFYFAFLQKNHTTNIINMLSDAVDNGHDINFDDEDRITLYNSNCIYLWKDIEEQIL